MSTDTHGEIGIAERLAEITAAHARLRAAAADLTEEQAREAIDLPGWTRGHILIHLADLSKAFARQARYAVRGETIEVYDGGRPTRDKSIEANHGRPVEWLRAQLEEGLTALEEAWAALGPDGWDLPCAYRDSPLLATQLAWWRETELHGVDLGVGRRSEDWSLALSAHVVDFLTARLPQSPAVALAAEDTGLTWGDTTRADVVVRGGQRALAAWISGRPTTATPVTDGGNPLPELNAWP
ncbi:maleylpyruvate isomerase family mycothiol-dependent enzyme [Kitasatospora atroaurantiaca]|uniref:Maleylpyruvate isomerase n=1 Tax=Kitasatospora atroaurantiaca TaxID=285545 RepID=A0A561EIJ2_9ACTN|nr:maleylpyruvate isomerase family mycothiol-dependent enzyme [Kitasatospora atroaurantiaca]TWE15392.1 maleylpyruvate isomerase [Kitasatospora atroaurantiaca]